MLNKKTTTLPNNEEIIKILEQEVSKTIVKLENDLAEIHETLQETITLLNIQLKLQEKR